MNNNIHIKNIISANNDNRLAIFVGAGISKCSDTDTHKIPDWHDLINVLKESLPNIEKGENDYPKIAQLYYLEYGEHIYKQKVKEYFPDYNSPSEIHKSIFDINPHIIITTNWDSLLEKTIEENAYLFDTISSDMNLVESTLQNKLIKMHGDFKNNNFVFKEDDYINYQNNFPLIENYIKSILSTHVVLFLGYSYNDINLKQILKWIQNHSEARPSMYLTALVDNPTQVKYLENHDITTILLNEYNIINSKLNEQSNKIHSFLSTIINNFELDTPNSSDEIINYVLNKIYSLNELKGILLDQIQKALSNCGFIYDNDLKPILKFYTRELTTDYNKYSRDIYQEFLKILHNIYSGSSPNKNMLEIFKILSKAQIKGILFPTDDNLNESKEYIPICDYLNIDENNAEKEDFNIFSNTSTRSENNSINILNQPFELYVNTLHFL